MVTVEGNCPIKVGRRYAGVMKSYDHSSLLIGPVLGFPRTLGPGHVNSPALPVVPYYIRLYLKVNPFGERHAPKPSQFGAAMGFALPKARVGCGLGYWIQARGRAQHEAKEG